MNPDFQHRRAPWLAAVVVALSLFVEATPAAAQRQGEPSFHPRDARAPSAARKQVPQGQANSRLLPDMDPEFSVALKTYLEAEGIRVCTGVGYQRIVHAKHGIELTCDRPPGKGAARQLWVDS